MSLLRCAREDEVSELLRLGHWPQGSPAEMREHVAGCGGCADLARLTMGFRAVREASASQARMMSPSLIWWRAQLRRRQHATEQVERPTRIAEFFALLVILSGVAGLAVWMTEKGYWRAWGASALDIGASIKAYAGGLGVVPLIICVAALLFLGLLTVWATADVE